VTLVARMGLGFLVLAVADAWRRDDPTRGHSRSLWAVG
jgi:hypothetical protein